MLVPAALENRNEGENDERKGDKGEQNVASPALENKLLPANRESRKIFRPTWM